jgi:hypothetical protein
MQNVEIEKKGHKKIKEKNPSQPGLTWLTRHTQHEIGIKTLYLQKKSLTKKAQVK